MFLHRVRALSCIICCYKIDNAQLFHNGAMTLSKSSSPLSFPVLTIFILVLVGSLPAQIVPTNDPPVYGPYNAAIAQGGDGVHKKMLEKDTVLRADSPWTMYAWVNIDAPVQ